ncbi:MAG: DUF4982 domain-containing protein [Kiritimatiellae bacterium]|nr:DUF4982 domain-containing protein [Kiritimatiellia bacterium]
MRVPITVFAAMSALAGVCSTVIDFNDGWEWRYGGESAWRTVDLPHDFMIESPWDGSANDSQRAFKPLGEAFYRKSFAYDPSWEGKRVLLDFGGIMFFGDVKINGMKVAETEYGYLGFETDITERLKKDSPNVVEVWAKVGGGRSGSRWYTGGGLYRSVKLKVANERRIARHGIFVRTKGETAEVEVELEGCRGLGDDLEIVAEILDGDKPVATARGPVTKGDNRRRFSVALPHMEVRGAKRWSPESPNLHSLVTELRERGTGRISNFGKELGKLLDRCETCFGFRDISFSKERGLEIDGRHIFLKGQSNHHDLGALGAAAYPDAIRRYFKTIKGFGFNSVRCSHNPYSEEFYDIADEEGIVVVDEIVDKWTGCWAGRRPYLDMWPRLLTEWVKRDRNHPSVVMWSLGNELQMNETCHDALFEDWGVTTYRMMDVVVKRWDPTRPTTVAMFPTRANGIGRNDKRFNDPAHMIAPELAQVTEVSSFNYQWPAYETYLKHNPDMIVYQSEATTSEWLAPYFGMDRARMVGCSYWGATEYWGESNKYPKKGWNWSFFSHTMKPYPQAWLMKSAFDRKTPVVHIGVVQADERETWNDVRSGQQALRENWNRKQGEKAIVWVFSNAPEVELFLNGRSLGKKRVPLPPPGDAPWRCAKGEKIHAVSFEVAWEPGELKAVASNGAEHAIRTTGPAVGLRLRSEGGGERLVYVWIEAVDAEGSVAPDATTEVRVSVEGAGRLLALDDGDHSTDQLFNVDTKKMKEGYLLAIVRRTGTGDIAISANGERIELQGQR